MTEHVSQQGWKSLEAVARWLESGAPHLDLDTGLSVDRFKMDVVVQVSDSCGTSCCIAGAVCQFQGLGLDSRNYDGGLDWFGDDGAFDLATTHLGISEENAQRMFEPWSHFYGNDDSFNSAARGAAVIRHFLLTGQIEWNRFNDFGFEIPEKLRYSYNHGESTDW